MAHHRALLAGRRLPRYTGPDTSSGRGPGFSLLRAVGGVNDVRVVLDRPLLTAEEVAALLAVPRSSVYEYARRRVDPLPSLLIGRHRRFDRRTVERWLAAQLSVTR